jgi:hypothetical protein
MSKMADFIPKAMEDVMKEGTISLQEAQEEAQKMIHDSGTLVQHVRVKFRLVTMPTEKTMQFIPCTWYDPFLGFFSIDGVDGVTRAKEASKDFRVLKGQTLEPVKG